MERKDEVSRPGIYTAVALSLIATIGQQLTTKRSIDTFNWVWLVGFGLSLLVLSGASVNFQRDRWLR